MKVRFDPDFVEMLKQVNVRIRKEFIKRIKIFGIDPDNPQLNNHPLREEWKGYRSIDITSDWRAIYSEKIEGEEIIAYFEALGTHEQLYK